MSHNDSQRRVAVQAALANFEGSSIGPASVRLLNAMGYRSGRTAEFSSRPADFLDELEGDSGRRGLIQRDELRVGAWRECAFVFQLTNDEIPFLASDTLPLIGRSPMQRYQMESMVFVSIDLGPGAWTRSELAAVARAINRCFPSPAIVLFRHGATEVARDGGRPLVMSMAVLDRRVNVKDPTRDVVGGRVSIIKDVDCAKPHHAHVKILAELSFEALASAPSNFRALYDAWLVVLSTETLNRRFYKDLSEWFMWASGVVDFPKGGGKDRNQIGVIRLLTRLIFIWFIKERGLVPDELFDAQALGALLKKSPATHGEGDEFYLAVLQNLFFATLNVEMGTERRWADTGSGMKGDMLVHSLYRHAELFRKPDEALRLFTEVPFLNGGLFECLDREVGEPDFKRTPGLKARASKEGTGYVLRIDGFSRRKEAQPHVPNKLFFGERTEVDLNADFGTKNREYAVRGLLHIFNAYKFTVHENTPVEEEVALDPELLGKVFENLLASYNEDTQTTARKLSGSFYTPRVVVDYMVDEALVAHFQRHLPDSPDVDARLRSLLSYHDGPNPFSATETAALIGSIERLKLIDPACGSGAFPMGALGKLVHVLTKLDPGNVLWRKQNRAPLEDQMRKAEEVPDASLQEERRDEAVSALEKFDRDFADARHAEYTRKLYLIEKCIHGVDKEPIAVQIAKLRFFISLVVSQEIDPKKSNRGVTALPNLETKIVAANTLIPVGSEQQVLRSQSVIQRERELASASKAYFGARTHKTKRKYRQRIVELRQTLADLLKDEHMFSAKEAKRLGSWDPFDQNSSADFFDPEWMFQMTEGFDVCIGNPPYVRQERIKDDKEEYQKLYDSYSGTADLYVYFYERSIKLLKPGGAFAFITSNKWYRAKYGEKIREWMNRQTQLLRIIDFGDAPVFDAIAYPTIVIATKRKNPVRAPAEGEQVRALNWVPGARSVEELPEVFEEQSFEVPQSTLKREGWQLEVPTRRRLLDKIRATGVSLTEYVGGRFYNGVKTGLNDPFLVTRSERDQLIAQDRRSGDVIKPYLQGRDVKRWSVESQDRSLIFVPWHFPLHEDQSIVGASARAEREFQKRFPAIYRRLLGFRPALEARDQTETGIRYEWYALQRPRTEIQEQILGPKIVYPDIYLHQSFAWDEEGYFPGNTCYFISTSEKWLCGVLNASVTEWFYEQISSRIMNGYLRAFSDKVQSIRIPPASTSQKKVVESLVDCMIRLPDPHIERLLNALVYELYFPDDLHAAGLRIFDAADAAGVSRLASLKGAALARATADLVATLKDTASPLYRQLFDLRALEVVRIIEGVA